MINFARSGFGAAALLLAMAAGSLTGFEARAFDESKIVLTPKEKAEKESRKACKVKICTVFRTKKTSGAEIACPIVKSWREEAIKDMVTGGKIGWRWGGVHCTFDLKLSQADLQKAVVESKYELKIPSHTIHCDVDRKKDGKMHKVSVAIAPVVAFENGKAVKARMNWGKVEAPILFKSLIWPGVKIDNATNVIGGKMVKMVNGFMTKKCDQVAGELPGAE